MGNTPQVYNRQEGRIKSSKIEDISTQIFSTQVFRPKVKIKQLKAISQQPLETRGKTGFPEYKVKFSNGIIYEGQIKQSEENQIEYSGYATMTIPSKYNQKSQVYKGQFKDSLFHGQGKYSGINYVYYGEWNQGKYHGKGKIMAYHKYCNQNYKGQFENGQRHGRGFYYSTHLKIKGTWREDSIHGFALMSNIQFEYFGQFQKSKFQGYGIKQKFVKINEKYEGFYKQASQNGFGVYKWGEKQTYVGMWKDDKKEGEGILIHKDENGKQKQLKGLWDDNKYEERDQISWEGQLNQLIKQPYKFNGCYKTNPLQNANFDDIEENDDNSQNYQANHVLLKLLRQI